MGQSPEKSAATERLDAAIKEALRAYAYDENTPLVVDWVVAVAQQGVDAEGDAISAYCHLFPEGEMPPHRAIGLLKVVGDYLARSWAED